MNTDEREERLEQIRQRHLRVDCYKSQMRTDIDFLLSLLDGQAAGESEYLRGRREAVDENVAHWQREVSDAATRMRDKCAKTIRDMIPNYRTFGAAPREMEIKEALETAAKAIESLTLDSTEEK